MAWVSPDDSDMILCDRCGVELDYADSAYQLVSELWKHTIFKNMHKHHVSGEFCKPCAQKMTPWIFRLKDICVLQTSVNQLKRVINERRKNNGPASHPASE